MRKELEEKDPSPRSLSLIYQWRKCLQFLSLKGLLVLVFVALVESISRVCLNSNGKFKSTTHFHCVTF